MDAVFESTNYMTQDEFSEWVEERAHLRDPNHYELLNGRVVMEPPAGWPHGGVESRIAARLGPVIYSRGLGEAFGSSQGFELPSGDTVEPDYSWVSTERWVAMRPPEPGKLLRVVPDLVVEILSTRTATYDRGEKKAIYERNGVREYWLVDSRTRTLTVFNRQGDRFELPVTLSDAERFTSKILPGVEFDVADLFPPPTR